MIPPDDDRTEDEPGEEGETGDDAGEFTDPGDDAEEAAFEEEGARDDDADEDADEDAGSDDEDPDDEGGSDDAPEEPEWGYLLTFTEQEERLPDEYPQHMEILDEMEVSEVLDLDLDHASDYTRWAAAQSLDEQGWTSQAIDVLRRIGASGAPHPALCYPEVLLKLHDLLRERGDYEEALAILERVEREDPDRRDACRERRAEVLILTGRMDEGLALFEKAVRAIPDDPWIPLTAAWALIRGGDYDGAVTWIARGERAARRLEDEEEIRSIDSEVNRLNNEARIRRERRARQQEAPPMRDDGDDAGEASPGEGDSAGRPAPARRAGAEEIRQSILAELDSEEVRLTRAPPRGEDEKQAAIERLGEMHRRASAAWDDAVERHDEKAIAALDDLQWEVVEVAERFGLKLPGVEE